MKDTDVAEVRANNEDLPSRYLDDAKHQINSVKKTCDFARLIYTDQTGEFDPGSERTLAAGLTHASRA